MDKQNPDIIYMKDVSAIIDLKDDDDIYINLKMQSITQRTIIPFLVKMLILLTKIILLKVYISTYLSKKIWSLFMKMLTILMIIRF